jgi:hypothetical protein
MGDSLGGADLLHFGAFTRQDARNQNCPARVVAQGVATVDQLCRRKLERPHKIQNGNWKLEMENRNWKFS